MSLLTPSATPAPSPPSNPPLPSLILGYLLIGLAWGFTVPFIRRAAKSHVPRRHPLLARLRGESESESDGGADVREDEGEGGVPTTWARRYLLGGLVGIWFGVTDLLRDWRYAVPLVLNLSGSVWFFVLVGGSELSLTVPITNSLAFLFTVLGDWYVDRKIISRDTWIGMGLSLGGIALCVQSKR